MVWGGNHIPYRSNNRLRISVMENETHPQFKESKKTLNFSEAYTVVEVPGHFKYI